MGRIDLEHLEKILQEGGVRVVGLPLISNVLGTLQPIKEAVGLAHQYGARVVVDGAQAMAHMEIDVQEMGIDALAFGSHKMFGPSGVGGLWVKEDWLSTWGPHLVGGGIVEHVDFNTTSFVATPYLMEPGSPNVVGVAGLMAAMDWLESLGWDCIRQRETEVLAFLEEGLLSIPNIQLLCDKPDIPLFSFAFDGIHPHDIGTFCDLKGIAIRTGHHCASPLHDSFGLEASSRISLSFVNTIVECQYFIDTLLQIERYFREI